MRCMATYQQQLQQRMPHLQLHWPQMQQQRLRLSLHQKMRKMPPPAAAFCCL